MFNVLLDVLCVYEVERRELHPHPTLSKEKDKVNKLE